jgi:hypothetical protein
MHCSSTCARASTPAAACSSPTPGRTRATTSSPTAPGSAINDVRQLGAEWADSQLDQRHRAVVSGWVRLPFELGLGGVATVGSGVPFNLTTARRGGWSFVGYSS